MPSQADLSQIILAALMVLFVFSSMSLVWTFAVIVPFMRGSSYSRTECELIRIDGVPEICWEHQFFKGIAFNPYSNIQLNCENFKDCKVVNQKPSCVQFYVTAEPFGSLPKQNMSGDVTRPFVLHLDEVDVTGMCWAELHCSLRPKIYETLSDCDQLVLKAKTFFSNGDQVNLGEK